MRQSSELQIANDPAIDPPFGDPNALIERLNQLQDQLDQLHQGLAHTQRLATLGTLSAIVAHEFNNILTPIINYAQLALARQEDQPLMQKAVTKSLEGAERAARICDSILGFAQQDENTSERTDVRQVSHIVQQSLECMAREPRKDGIDLVLQLDSLDSAEPGRQIAVAPVALQQVLVNLILNARRAMGRKGGRLAVAGAIQPDNCLQLSVQDTGPGVPQHLRDRIFEPFVTCPVNTDPQSRQRSGTGLGLSICQQIVQRAGGSIELITPATGLGESDAGSDIDEASAASCKGGATFLIQLPLVQS
ncbi:MAG: HAMP domain-containing histidine kinase [Phycisphaeraceae bacterium]|nr:HAMP domain-containing histidine kinase [Phycisphaeraceae bacterium]